MIHLQKNRLLQLLALCVAVLLPATTIAKENKMSTKVRITTSMGTIDLALDAAAAPKTVENFLQYVDDKHYDGTIFHRVIPRFMIQGGGFTPDMQQKPTRAPVEIESMNGLRNDRGTIAMARTMDPNSATSQFFINHIDNDFLNYRNKTAQGIGYTVFGSVIAGLDVVDKIAAVATGNSGQFQNVPRQPVMIESITRISE